MTEPKLEGEILAFLQSQDGYRQNGHHLSHRFKYNGIECGGIVTVLPYTYSLRIMPCNPTEDIGAGPGQTIFKEFDRKIQPMTEPKPITEDQKETWGKLIDRVENLRFGLDIPIPSEMHVKQLRSILPEVVKELKANFVDITGENPWE